MADTILRSHNLRRFILNEVLSFIVLLVQDSQVRLNIALLLHALVRDLSCLISGQSADCRVVTGHLFISFEL